MRNPFADSVAILMLLPALANAGVVMDLVTTNAAGKEMDRTNILSQSSMIRMDDGSKESGHSMIFLGNEFLVLDHSDKSYIVMDEAMLNEVATQMTDAMKKMEAQLASLPPEQRAMAEQMMKGQMSGMMGQQDAPAAAPKVEALGKGQWQSYSCRNYAVYEGAAKTQEVCAAALNEIDGMDEMLQAFRGMAEFITKMTESMPMRSDRGLNPGELMDRIDGFPVHTVEFADGKISRETSLESIVEQNLDEALFAVPEGYERQDPFKRR